MERVAAYSEQFFVPIFASFRRVFSLSSRRRARTAAERWPCRHLGQRSFILVFIEVANQLINPTFKLRLWTLN